MLYKITSFISVALCSSLVAGCSQEAAWDEPDRLGEGVSEVDSHGTPAVFDGEVVATIPLGVTGTFQLIDTGTDAVISFTGDIEERENVQALLWELSEAESYGAVYQIVSEEDEVPDGVAALDAKYDKGPELEADSIVAPQGEALETGEAAGDDVSTTLPGYEPQHHANPASDSYWDWNADARWFLNLSPSSCDERWSATNVTWASIYKNSRQHWVQAMAASHSYSADFTVKEWNGSNWVAIWTERLQPRHYRYLAYGSSSSGYKYRDFSIVGRGSVPRIHLHAGWNLQTPSGWIGQVCHRTY